jgi:hypothetical protein
MKLVPAIVTELCPARAMEAGVAVVTVGRDQPETWFE